MHCALESPKVCAPDLPGVGGGDQQRTSDPQSCQEIDVCFKATKLVVICYKPQNKTAIYVHPEVDWNRKKTAIAETTGRASQGGGCGWWKHMPQRRQRGTERRS